MVLEAYRERNLTLVRLVVTILLLTSTTGYQNVDKVMPGFNGWPVGSKYTNLKNTCIFCRGELQPYPTDVLDV